MEAFGLKKSVNFASKNMKKKMKRKLKKSDYGSSGEVKKEIGVNHDLNFVSVKSIK